MSNMHMYGYTPDGAWVPLLVSPEGSTSQPVNTSAWSYAVATGGITDTADNALKAAVAGQAIYLQSLQLVNKGATATEVVVKDGASTVLWRGYVGASMLTGVNYRFDPPLVGSINTAMNVACVTTGTATIVSAQGYTNVSAAALDASLTVGNEIFTDSGLPLLDDNGVVLTLN